MSDFDWVSARAACSLRSIFEQLKDQLAVDVDKQRALKKDQGYVLNTSIDRATITHHMEPLGGVRDAMEFVLTQTAIEVRDRNGQAVLRATPTLNDDGECRLKISGKEGEMELWHLRKMALEGLFFGS